MWSSGDLSVNLYNPMQILSWCHISHLLKNPGKIVWIIKAEHLGYFGKGIIIFSNEFFGFVNFQVGIVFNNSAVAVAVKYFGKVGFALI